MSVCDVKEKASVRNRRNFNSFIFNIFLSFLSNAYLKILSVSHFPNLDKLTSIYAVRAVVISVARVWAEVWTSHCLHFKYWNSITYLTLHTLQCHSSSLHPVLLLLCGIRLPPAGSLFPCAAASCLSRLVTGCSRGPLLPHALSVIVQWSVLLLLSAGMSR